MDTFNGISRPVSISEFCFGLLPHYNMTASKKKKVLLASSSSRPNLLGFGFDLTQSQSSKPISRNGYGPNWRKKIIINNIKMGRLVSACVRFGFYSQRSYQFRDLLFLGTVICLLTYVDLELSSLSWCSFPFSFNNNQGGSWVFLFQSAIYNLSNHKRESDAPQISHVTFPAIRYDVHFGLWPSVEARFKNCFFGFRTALLGWTLIVSLTTIAYLALVARAWMYGCVSFSGLLMAICAVFYSLFLPLCILRRETNNHPNHCESTRKPHR